MELKNILLLIAVSVCSYLFGNINNAVILSSARKKDVRSMGSGNPGTMNMMRNFGAKLGALTLVLDIAKGALPTYIAKLIFAGSGDMLSTIAAYTAGFFVILGHIYPVFMKFKGGKGIASTLGVFLVANPVLTLIAFAISVIYIMLFEYGSVGNLIMITIMCCVEGIRYNNIFGGQSLLLVLSFLLLFICFLTWFAHRNNLYRLMMGKEHKTRLVDILKPKRRRKQTSKNTSEQ
jgi:glycerol-3-phosphate acyltransferase PlsY